MEMSFFFEYEYEAKMDGLNGKFTGMEIVDVRDYEEVERMIKTAQKVAKKRNMTITFRSVQIQPDYVSKAIYRLTNEYGGGHVLHWEDWNEVADELQDSVNAKTVKRYTLEAIKEYKRREELAEQNIVYAVA